MKKGDLGGDAEKRRVNKNVSKDQANIQDRDAPFPDGFSDERMMVVSSMSMNQKVNIQLTHQPLLLPPPNPLPHPLLLLHLLMKMGVMVTHFYHHLIHHQCWL